MGRYGEDGDLAWGWLLSALMPNLSMVVGVLANDVIADAADHKEALVKRASYVVAVGVSTFYLSTLALTILLMPLADASPMQYMLQSNVWIAPLQGLVGATLGVFFASAKV